MEVRHSRYRQISWGLVSIATLLNPINLIAVYLAVGGIALWGGGEDYEFRLTLKSLFYTFGLPSLAFFVLLSVQLFILCRLGYQVKLRMYLLCYAITPVLIFWIAKSVGEIRLGIF